MFLISAFFLARCQNIITSGIKKKGSVKITVSV